MKVKIEDLKDGAVIYNVTVFGNFEVIAYVEAMFIIGEPFESKFTAPELFCKYKCIDPAHHYLAEFSLRDANIVPNDYNIHQAFTTREEADAYYERILSPNGLTAFERDHFINGFSRSILYLPVRSTSHES